LNNHELTTEPAGEQVASEGRVNARQLKALLAVYLKHDLRGNRSFAQTSGAEYITANRALLVSVGVNVLLGLLLTGSMIASQASTFVYSISLFTATLFIVSAAIIAEAGNTIFNESEADIIGHLPMSARTLLAAKMLSLFLFTLLLALATNLFPVIGGIWISGPAFMFAHAVSATLVAMFATALIVVSYGLLMRYVSKERLDSIITMLQVGLVIVLMLGYQLLPRLLDADEQSLMIVDKIHWYFFLFPPAWFAGLSEVLIGKADASTLSLAAFGLLSLVLLLALAFKKLSAGYSPSMTRAVAAPLPPPVAEAASNELRSRAGESLKSLVLGSPPERATFELVKTYLLRNREIKLRLYPSLAYILIFPFLGMFTEGLADPFESGEGRFYAMMGAGMISSTGLAAVESLLFSEHYKAAYILRVAPITRIGYIRSGFRKAVFIYIVLPGFAVLFALYAALWANPLHALLVLLPWLAIAPAQLMVPFLFREALPLSRKYQKGEQSARNILIFIVSFTVLIVLAVAQGIALSMNFPYALFLAIVAVIALLCYVVLRAMTDESRPIDPDERES
jgi:hypothetical protein